MSNYDSINKITLPDSKVNFTTLPKAPLGSFTTLSKSALTNTAQPSVILQHLPKISKTSLSDISLNASQRYPYEEYLRRERQTTEEWQKVLDKAELQANMNDPTQLNSLADVVSSIVFGTQYANVGPVKNFIKNHGLNWNGPLNIFGGIADLIDYMWQYNVKPIKQGEWSIFGKNFLVNLSESLDYLAAPVKGLVKEGTGLIDGVGANAWGINWGTDQVGRPNYYYDTGNEWVDFAAEVFSDPSIWFTLGLSAAVRGLATKTLGELTEAAIKSGLKEVVETVGKETAEDWLKNSFKKAVRITMSGKDVGVSDLTELLLKGTSKKSFAKALTPEVASRLSADTVQNVAEVLLKATKEATDSKTLAILKSFDKLDTAFVKTAFWPAYGSYKVVSKVRKMANSRTLRVIDPFIKEADAVSPFDYKTVMDKVDEVNNSLIGAAEKSGLKGFDNAEVQKIFYKHTKEDIRNIQKIIKKHSAGAKTNFTALRFELATYLTNRHHFDVYTDLIKAFDNADPITRFTDATINKLQQALQAYIKNPFDGNAEAYLKTFLPENASLKKFIGDNIDITKMFDKYSAVIDDISAQTDLFNSFKGSIKDLGNTFKQLQEAESFIKNFAEGTINKEAVANILKALGKEKQFPPTRLLNIVSKALTDVEGLRAAGFLDGIKASDSDLFDTALLNYVRGIDAEDAERYIKLFLPEGTRVDDFVEHLFDTYATNVLADELLKPVYASLGLSSKQALVLTTHNQFLTASFKKSRLAQLVTDSKAYAEAVKKAKQAGQVAPKASLTAALAPEEAIALFKQDVVDSLKEFYDVIADGTSDFVNATKAQVVAKANLFEEAYRSLYSNIKTIYSEYTAYSKSWLDNNPTLKRGVDQLENYGKELLSTSQTQRKITELVKNVTGKQTAEVAFDTAEETVSSITTRLKTLLTEVDSQLDTVDALALSEDAENIFLKDAIQNALKDFELVLNKEAKAFNVDEFLSIVQNLDNTVKAYRKRLDKAFNTRADSELHLFLDSYNKLESIVDSAYDSIKVSEDTFSLVGGATVYALKQEQVFNTLTYLSNPTIMDFVHKTANRDLAANDFIFRYADKEYVKTLIEQAPTSEIAELHRLIGEDVALVLKGASSIQEYEMLINSLEKSVALSKEIRSALLSTINSPHIARMSVDKIAAAQGYDDLFNRIFTGIENYVNAQRKTGRYTLDNFRAEQLGEGFFEGLLGVTTEEWLKMAHHADADVLTTLEYFKKELPDFKLRKNDITIDIETSSLNKFQGEVLEIALHVDGHTVVFKRHFDNVNSINVSDSLLNLYTHSGMTLDDARAALFEYYNKTYNGKQAANEVLYFTSEAELLQAVQEQLYRAKVVLDDSGSTVLKTHPDAPRLLGHNINGYDIDFLKLRAEKNNINYFNETLNRFEHVDSYQLIQEKYGFLKLNDAEKTAIKDMMQDYISLRTMFAEGSVDTLAHAGEDFINAIPNELSAGLKRLSEHVVEVDSSTLGIDSQRLFDTLYKELKQARIEGIRRPNMSYAKHLFTEDQINSAMFKDALYDILKQDANYKHYTDAQLRAFVNYLNPTKAFYAGQDFINTIGFKKIFDPTIVKNWFNYTVDGVAMTEVPQKLGKTMFTIARHIERSASYVKNTFALESFRPALDDFLNAVQNVNVLKHPELNHEALRYLVPNVATISEKYGLALYLRQLLGNTKVSTGGALIDLLPKNVVEYMDEVIENNKLFTHSTISDTNLTFAELCKDLGTDEFWTSAAVYEAKVNSFSQNIQDFRFITDFDNAGLFSAETQIYAHGAQRTLNLLRDWTGWLKEANTEQLYDAHAKTHFITEALNKQTLYNVMYYKNPEELVERLAWNFGGATFVKNEAPDIYRKLIQDEQVLKDLGVLVYEDNTRVYTVLDRRVLDFRCEIQTNNHINTKHIFLGKHGEPLKEIARPTLKELNVDGAIEACRKEFTLELAPGKHAVGGVIDGARLTQFGENIKNARAGINTITNGRFVGCNSDIMVKKTMRHLYEQMPEAVQQAMGDIDSFLDNPAWFSETTFNMFNLGSTSAKRALQPGVPTHIMSSYELTTKLALKTQETRLKFLDMILNNDMRLDIGVWADTANDAQVIKYLKDHPELTVAVLHKAKNAQGYNIKRIAINTVEDLHNARRLRASVLTNSMYSRTAAVVYSSVYDNGFLNGWTKIAKLYKIGQLSVFNFGTLMRNFFDSTIKMFLSTEDFIGTVEAGYQARKQLKGYNNALYHMMATSQINTEAVERIAKTYGVSPTDILNDIGYSVAWYKKQNIKDVINASILYEKYNTALDDIIKMDSNAVLRPQNVDFYFNYMSKTLDKDSFYEVHKFITQGASAGNTSVLEKVLRKDAGKHTGRNILKQMGEVYGEQGLLDTIIHLTGKLSSANANLEQIIRLTQHMQQMRSGLNFAESNLKIIKTHFDYADKTDITKSIELLFPYYNFKMKNFEYWADLIETKPWVAHLFEDAMTPVWDFDSYDTYQEHLELANNESLAYQILSGNIPLNDSGLVLKLNPSITDVIQMVTNPFGTAQSSLWSPLNEGFKEIMLELWKQGKTNNFINNTFGLNEYNADPENQRTRLQKVMYNLPLIGPTLQRVTESAPKYYERSNSKLAKTLPATFGVTSRWNLENIKAPEELEKIENRRRQLRKEYAIQQAAYNAKRLSYYYNNNKYKSKSKSVRASKKISKTPKRSKVKFNKSYYYNTYNKNYKNYVSYYNSPYNRYKENSLIHRTKVAQPERVYRDNIYWKYYTKTGKRRMDILNAKTTRKNLQMKIKLMYDYYR